MLNKSQLKSDLTAVFKDTIPGAFEQSFQEMYPIYSVVGNEKAKKFGETFSDLVSEVWAERLSDIIDGYIKKASLSANILLPPIPISIFSMSTLPFILPINSGNLNLGNPGAGLPGPNAIKVQ